jgi:hypothetical protein
MPHSSARRAAVVVEADEHLIARAAYERGTEAASFTSSL